MKLPRLVFGETARERELRALAVGLQAECDRSTFRALADRKANTAAIASLGTKLNEAIAERDDLASRLEAAEREAREERLTLKIVVRNLRKLADDIEPTTNSQEDRPAKDSGTDGAGTTPE